jgi:3-oxoadipate enol-lactonase
MPTMTSNGVSIHYTLDGDACAPVLLFSNSLGASLEMWEPQVAELSRHFRLLRYDTRGHGRSSVPPGPYSIAMLAGDVISLFDHLNIQRAHVCGLSMGGITAMWLAIHHPERIDRLVLANTAALIGPPDNWTKRAAAVEQDGVASIASSVVARWLTPEYAQAHPEQVAHLVAMLSATDATGYAANCIAVRDNDLRAEVARISAPTLVISGSGDQATPPADGRFLNQMIRGSRYLELDAAHLSNQEQPDRFNQALRDFLS